MIYLAAIVVLIIVLLWTIIDMLETSYRMDKLTGTNQDRWKRILKQ